MLVHRAPAGTLRLRCWPVHGAAPLRKVGHRRGAGIMSALSSLPPRADEQEAEPAAIKPAAASGASSLPRADEAPLSGPMASSSPSMAHADSSIAVSSSSQASSGIVSTSGSDAAQAAPAGDGISHPTPSAATAAAAVKAPGGGSLRNRVLFGALLGMGGVVAVLVKELFLVACVFVTYHATIEYYR